VQTSTHDRAEIPGPVQAAYPDITRRAKGVSIKTTMEELAPYMWGWRNYFGFCETPEVLIALTR
jgi:Group II intron, maturase-specific domain